MYSTAPYGRVSSASHRGLGDLPGASASSYDVWIAAVKAAGGIPTTLPNDATEASKWSDTLYLPNVATGAWPAPDDYSADGHYAYYRAPEPIVAFVANGGLTTPTPGEVQQGTNILLQNTWYGQLEHYLTTAGKYVAIGAVAYFVVLPLVRDALTRRR